MKTKWTIVALVASMTLATTALALSPSKYREIKDDGGVNIGNCVFTPVVVKQDTPESAFTPQKEFKCGEITEIHARCYFPKTVSEYKGKWWGAYAEFGDSLHSKEDNFNMTEKQASWDKQHFDFYLPDAPNKHGALVKGYNPDMEFGGLMKAWINEFCRKKSGGERGKLYIEVRSLYDEGMKSEVKVESNAYGAKLVEEKKQLKSMTRISEGEIEIVATGKTNPDDDAPVAGKKDKKENPLKKLFGK